MFSSVHTVICQNQKIVDSLINRYNLGIYKGYDELEILGKIVDKVIDSDVRLQFSELLIQKASQDSIKIFLLNGFLQKGHSYRDKGNYTAALDSYFQSLKFAVELDNDTGKGIVLISIADIYSEVGNSENAIEYYNKGILVLRVTNDSLKLASALYNVGDHYLHSDKYDLSLVKFEESGILFEKLNFIVGTAYNLGNIGMVYAKKGKDKLAKESINEAISILEELEDHYAISNYLIYMSDIYLKQNDWNTALNYTNRSLQLAQKYGLKKEITGSFKQLSKIHELKGNLSESYDNYKNYIIYKDSITNLESVQKMADIRTDYEVSQKQIEVDLLEKDFEISMLKSRKQKNIIYISIIVGSLVLLLALGLYRRNKYIQKTKSIIEEEKNRSEELLLNILPEETAKELKENGKVRAKRFESVSVLFADFKGFTKYAESLPPEELVKSVDFYFSKFDKIMESYNLEKIKTVGDEYMCAAGLPFPTKDHSYKIVLAALDIIDFVKKAKSNNHQNLPRYEIRVGINTGPVVAGVVGTKKFAYDIWGDTVNVASRMESNSETGRINISENTFKAIKDKFNCEYRGEIKVKNRNTMKMYFVKDRKKKEIGWLT